jgi:hypothetical protein
MSSIGLTFRRDGNRASETFLPIDAANPHSGSLFHRSGLMFTDQGPMDWPVPSYPNLIEPLRKPRPTRGVSDVREGTPAGPTRVNVYLIPSRKRRP